MRTLRTAVSGDTLVPDFIRDVAGHIVDLRQRKWRIHSADSSSSLLDWVSLSGCDKHAVYALRLHIVRLLETKSSRHAYNIFQGVSRFLRALRDDEDAPSTSVTLASLTWYLEQHRAGQRGYRFHHVRQWYIDSADRMLEGFNDEVVYALEDLRVEGNPKGEAVLSANPNQGPLNEFEEEALRSALLRDDGPIEERAAMWLAFAFGTNPANLALLREEDFRVYRFEDDTPPAYFLSIPQIKKRRPARSTFRKRNVDQRLSTIIAALIEHNRRRAPSETTRPLFRRPYKRHTLLRGPLAEYAYHHTAQGITALIARCAKRLAVSSPRTKLPLAVTTRRMRYTYASKMVRQGVTARDLADLLDHSDTQNVQVYYKADSRFVERLDKTIAVHLGPTIKAFMGEVVTRPRLTIDLIPFRDLPALGVCGASFSCGLSAPKNCYTCTEFSAFADGAHEAVLESLVAERDNLLTADLPRIAEQLDRTILAVGEVVAQTSEGVDAHQ